MKIIFSILLTLLVASTSLADTGVKGGGSSAEIASIANAQKTAFGEMSIGELTPKVHLSFPYNINAAFVNTTTIGSGTVTQADSKAVLQTTAASSSQAHLTSRRVLKYNTGQGGLVRFTAVFTPCTANSSQLIGIGDAIDGFYFGCDGATFGLLRRQDSVDNWTVQTSWNGDKAAGASILPFIDITKGNVYQIRYQWLGFGAITFWVENPWDGEFIKVHTIRYANAHTDPSIFNPSLPLHAEVVNVSNATNIMLQTSSMMGGIEGKEVDLGELESISNTKEGVTTTETNVVTIQNKTTFATKTNRVEIVLKAISYGVDGTKPAIVRLIKNVTLGGTPSYTDISANTSVVSYDVAGTTITGGEVLLSLATNKSDGDTLDLSRYNIVLEPGETFTISVEASSGTTDASVSLVWSERF
jgi:hypothetical protein